MDLCAACLQLVGESVDARPHESLRLEHMELGNSSDEETWRCKDCDNRLFRLSGGSVRYRNLHRPSVWEKD